MPEKTREQALRLAFDKAGITAKWRPGDGATVHLSNTYMLSVIFADYLFNYEGRRDLVAETGLMETKGELLMDGTLAYDDVKVWRRAGDVVRHIISLRKKLDTGR